MVLEQHIHVYILDFEFRIIWKQDEPKALFKNV